MVAQYEGLPFTNCIFLDLLVTWESKNVESKSSTSIDLNAQWWHDGTVVTKGEELLHPQSNMIPDHVVTWCHKTNQKCSVSSSTGPLTKKSWQSVVTKGDALSPIASYRWGQMVNQKRVSTSSKRTATKHSMVEF